MLSIPRLNDSGASCHGDGGLFSSGMKRSAATAFFLASFALLFGTALSGDAGMADAEGSTAGDRLLRKVTSGFSAASLQTAANARLGESMPTPPNPALPFSYSGAEGNRDKAAECLANAAWYEAGNDPIGQRAVMQTVINRVNHSAYPNSVCGVIFEGSHLSTGCQFTFTCDGSLGARRPSARALASAKARAEEALRGEVDESIGTATHYHADYVYPYWADRLDRIAIVGPHIFYKFRGSSGTLRSRSHLEGEADFNELAARKSRSSKAIEAVSGASVDVVELTAGAMADIAVSETVREVSRNAFYIAVGDSRAAGRWAVSALEKCRGRNDCQVIGYENETAALRNRRSDLSDRQRPLFLFVRDKASGMEISLWDCQRVSRNKASQCLPENSVALGNLLRDRY